MSTSGPERHVDVLVVGAGPAGSSAACAAAGGGASVLLVDSKREIGLPVRCAEFVPRLMAREVEIPDTAVAQTVDEMAVLVEEEAAGESRSAELGRVRSPGFILHRERLEERLVEIAARAGAEVLLSTRATPAGPEAVELTGEGGAALVRAKVVVAADGPFSAFHTEGGARSGRLRGPHVPARTRLPAVQFTVPLARPTACTEVRFARRFRLGYAWLFPKGELANVGVGCAPAGGRRELLPLLQSFVQGLVREGKLAPGPPVRRTAGWIPVWGPPGSAVGAASGPNVLFGGDAGGFTDPVTGAGIWPAITTGRMAGGAAAKFALEGEASSLSAYDDDWRDFLGPALERAASARRAMEAEWDSPDLPGLLSRIWPGL